MMCEVCREWVLSLRLICVHLYIIHIIRYHLQPPLLHGGALVDAAGSQTGSLTSATWKLALNAAFPAFVLMLCKLRLLAGRLACGKASHQRGPRLSSALALTLGLPYTQESQSFLHHLCSVCLSVCLAACLPACLPADAAAVMQFQLRLKFV